MFPISSPPRSCTPPVISSPLKKLQRRADITAHSLEAVPQAFTYEGFDTIFNLNPNEIIGIQEEQTNYVCGVLTNGKMCRNDLYCNKHSLEQRKQVERSLPLESLVAEESKNIAWFRKRRMLTKLYYDCKAYWHKHPSASMTPMTCSRTSCDKEGSSSSYSSRCVSLSSHNDSGMIANSDQGTFSSLRQAFLKRLSCSADVYKEDVVSYLFYRLACYEAAGVEMRTRELQTRYKVNECDFAIDSEALSRSRNEPLY